VRHEKDLLDVVEAGRHGNQPNPGFESSLSHSAGPSSVTALVLMIGAEKGMGTEPPGEPISPRRDLASATYRSTAARVQAFVEQGGGCRATFFNYRRYLLE
jgi:hypothetical protein